MGPSEGLIWVYNMQDRELSGRVLDSRPRGGGFDCVVVLEQDTFILA